MPEKVVPVGDGALERLDFMQQEATVKQRVLRRVLR
jgi:hypothetical protein